MNDTVNWPDNVELIKAMREGEQQEEAYYRPFFVALFHSDLIVPHAIDIKPDGNSSRYFTPCFVVLDGKETPLVFTDGASFQRAFTANQWAIVMPTRILCQIALANGFTQIALDVQGPISHLLQYVEVQAIAKGQIPTGSSQVEQLTKASVQVPGAEDELKIETKRALREICVQNGVSEMWWFGISVSDGPPFLTLLPSSPEMLNQIHPQIVAAWRKWQTPEAREPGTLFIDLYNINEFQPSPNEGERIFPE